MNIGLIITAFIAGGFMVLLCAIIYCQFMQMQKKHREKMNEKPFKK